MKKLLLIFFIIILFLIFVSWYNLSPRTIISRLIKNEGIKTGQLRYKIYLLRVFPIGDAVFQSEKVEEYKGQKVYHLSAIANNLKFFSIFFNAYAALDSYIDIQQLNPIAFNQKLIVTGKQDMYREVIYDQKNRIMSIAGVRRQILSNTQDPLSAIFNVRRIDFDKTREFEMNINTNQKNYILKGITQPKDLSIHKKIYKIVFLKANISRHDKNPYHKSRASMVLLEEGGNIPILINVFTGGILINARLVDIR